MYTILPIMYIDPELALTAEPSAVAEPVQATDRCCRDRKRDRDRDRPAPWCSRVSRAPRGEPGRRRPARREVCAGDQLERGPGQIRPVKADQPGERERHHPVE